MHAKYTIVAVLLLVLFLQCIPASRDKSAIFDETAHLPAGYAYLITGDFRLNSEHPPLTKIMSALPLLFLDLQNPTTISSWGKNDAFVFGEEFLYHSGQDADKIIFWGRLPIILLSLLLGLVIFVWAKELFGFKAGVFALFLFCFCPEIIAHAGLVTEDMGVSLFILLSVYALFKYINKPAPLRLILFGICLGLALLSKFSALILAPFFLICLYGFDTTKKSKHRFAAVFLVLLTVFFTVWAGYGFKTGKVLREDTTHNTLSYVTERYPEILQKAVYCLGENIVIPFPLYLEGFGWILYHGKQKQESFFWGRHFYGNTPLELLFAFFIKTPIPLIILSFFSLFLTIKRKILFKKQQMFLLLFPFTYFIFMGFFAPALRVKYMLPVYPFICIFSSQLVQCEFLKVKAVKAVFVLLCLWYLIGTLKVYPHYLAYFNEIAGGPKNGYKYLVDSNLDWGQDLKLLKKYLDKNGISEINLAYFGTADPGYYKMRYQKLEPFHKVAGWTAVSATYLQGVHTAKGGYDWLKEYKPQACIGYSIFVYNIKE